MTVSIETLNAELVESAANTFTDVKKEIPGTSGAKSVVFKTGLLQATMPDIEDAINRVDVCVIAGDKTDRAALSNLGDGGCFGFRQESMNSDGTDILFATEVSPLRCEGPIVIPKSEDGKYYVTLGVEGTGNAAAKYVRFQGTFIIER